jgi:hypothetical protein
MKLKKTRKKGFDALLAVFETRRNIIDICKVTPAAVSRWSRDGKVPECRRHALIEAAKQRGYELTNEQLRGIK